ncbi:hypothetical protein C7M84_000445 [Penaeus vannamei]|uniref:Amino acid transporter transmembrane domain-containing protein n=1 Tax=Penaeus vannamei TaxID=6689 RepID=A0A3R7QJH9_PENVA|nr:hypothetical protein C7M84_000445 [Penaeus vannamei]
MEVVIPTDKEGKLPPSADNDNRICLGSCGSLSSPLVCSARAVLWPFNRFNEAEQIQITLSHSTNEKMNFEETEKLFSKRDSYAATNGSAESPAASAESANGWAPEENGGEGRARRGLTMMLGAIFLVGEMAGAGVLNLPKAMVNTGWVGVPLIIVLCAGVAYSGTRLAECWVLLEERWPEYRVPCRRPYPA